MITLGRIKEITNNFIKLLIYGNTDVRTAPQVTPQGITSKPIKEKIGLYIETEDETKSVFIGTIDIPTDRIKDGEIKIFAVNDNDEEQSFLQCHNSDQATADNWAVKFNELKSAFDELKEKYNDCALAMSSHTHTVSGTVTLTPTVIDPVVLPSISTANIDNAKNKRITISDT